MKKKVNRIRVDEPVKGTSADAVILVSVKLSRQYWR